MSEKNETIEYLKPISEKIIKNYEKIESLKNIRNGINEKKVKFEKMFENTHQKHLLFGFLCVLAIFFDYFISLKTMKPLAKTAHLPTEILALLFSLFDMTIAVLASGVLAKSILEIVKNKKIWKSVLWLLFALKSTLFIVYASKAHTNWTAIAIILFLAFIIYLFLHFAGSGIYFVFGKVKYWILLEVWHEKPEEVKKKINALCRKLTQECTKFELDKNEVFQRLDVEKICKG